MPLSPNIPKCRIETMCVCYLVQLQCVGLGGLGLGDEKVDQVTPCTVRELPFLKRKLSPMLFSRLFCS